MQKKIIWQHFHPDFEYRQDLDDSAMAWTGHIFFGYDLIRNLKPERVVELGTFKGTSLFSFAQAAKDAKLNTEIFAVDSWEGDENLGFYGNEVYESVMYTSRKYYIGQNIRLMRMYFDEALSHFEDKSIDVLHIDGLHIYEAVKHDYDTWRSKVKDDGVILFHDTQVPDFGVWQVWDEVKKSEPKATYLNFRHNYGLGVIFLDGRDIDFSALIKEAGVEDKKLDAVELTHRFYEERAAKFLYPMLRQKAEMYNNMTDEVKHLKENLKGEEEKNIVLTKEIASKEAEITAKVALIEEKNLEIESIRNSMSNLREVLDGIRSRKGFKVMNRILSTVGKGLN